MKLQVVVDTAISPALDVSIREGLCACFPPDREVFCRTRAWHGSHPTWSVLVTEDGHDSRVVAHAGIVERQILIGRERVCVAGVQNVYVLPENRGAGLFEQVMSAALEEARRRWLDFGVLFCSPEIGRKYARLGWLPLEGRNITRTDEHGRRQPLPPKNVTFYRLLTGRSLPTGDLDLLGNDW